MYFSLQSCRDTETGRLSRTRPPAEHSATRGLGSDQRVVKDLPHVWVESGRVEVGGRHQAAELVPVGHEHEDALRTHGSGESVSSELGRCATEPRRYLVPEAPAEHHVRVHPLVHEDADLGQFGAQDGAPDQVDLGDVRHVPHASGHNSTGSDQRFPLRRVTESGQNLHPLPLDDLDVVLGPGVEPLWTQSAPEVTPQLPVFGQHGGDDGPGGQNRSR